MSPELQLVIQVAVVAVGGVVSFTSRSALSELRKIAATVEEHGRSLATGNERFRGLDRELQDLRDEIRDLTRGRVRKGGR